MPTTEGKLGARNRFASSILAVGGFLVAWHLVSIVVFSRASVFPSPVQVATAWWNMSRSGELWRDIASSLVRICVGFMIAFVAAVVLGYTAVILQRVYSSLKVVMDLLSSIPPIAWTPLSILWFGIGNAPAYFIVFLGTFFPMFTSIYSGVKGVERDWIDAAKTLGASSRMIARKVVLPASIPQVLTGITAGVGVGWFNVIAAELIGVQSGLGYRLQLNRFLLASDNVIALMLTIGALGFCMVRIVSATGKLLAPWAIQDESRPEWLRRRRILVSYLRHRGLYLRRSNNAESLFVG